MSVKISALPAVTTLDPTDVFPVNKAGVTSKILFSSLQTLLSFQPLNGNLTTLAGIVPSAVGQNILAQAVPSSTSYANIDHAGLWTYLTPLQVVADLMANGNGVDRTTAQNLLTKIINGVDMRAGTAPDTVAASSDTQTTSDSYLFRLLKIGFTGGSMNFRFTGSTDVTFPKSGVLATVTKIQPTSDATSTSASTLDLDSTDGSQIDITGTTPITAITLAEGTEKIIRFTGITTLTNGATLLLPGAANITTANGDYAKVLGFSGGVVKVMEYIPAGGAKLRYGGDFVTGAAFSTVGPVSFVGPASTTIRTPITADLYLPQGVGTLAKGLNNHGATDLYLSASTRTYIAGSHLTIPASKMQVGTKFSWRFNMVKTAAGTATSVIDICVGTARSVADPAVCSFTKPAGTAAADEGFVIIEAVVKSIGAGSSVMLGEMVVMHNLASTGHMTIPIACVHNASGGTDDFTVSDLFVGLCITTGASDAITINQVSAQAHSI